MSTRIPDAAAPVLVTEVLIVVLVPGAAGSGEAVVPVTVKPGGPAVGAPNVAVTERVPLIATVQAPVPLHPLPLQPLKTEPAAAVALSVTQVPLAYDCEQSVPHVIPPGSLVTLPLPVPARTTMSVAPLGGGGGAGDVPPPSQRAPAA
jgi:hypothetical protein